MRHKYAFFLNPRQLHGFLVFLVEATMESVFGLSHVYVVAARQTIFGGSTDHR